MPTHDPVPAQHDFLPELSETLGKLADPWFESASRPGRRTYRSLSIEPLEDRAFPSAQGLPDFVSPAWFQDCSGADRLAHAGGAAWSTSSSDSPTSSIPGQADVYDWIVRFNAGALTGISSAAGTGSLLVGSGVEFEVLRGLGLVGQVLVRSSGTSSDAVANLLGGNTHVASFERDEVHQVDAVANDPQMSQLWGLKNTGQNGGTPGADIHAQDAWSLSTGSRNVVVAVLDTGVDYTHPDLAANLWTNSREIAGNGADDDGDGLVDDVHGYNFAANTGNPMDDNSHGTHVAGTIAGVGNNGVGVTGVNWNVSIMPLKFLAANGSGYTSDAVRAINYATLMRNNYGVNLRVINASWGGGGFSAAMRDAIQSAGNAGILFVAAAGNSGQNNDRTANYPSGYDSTNVIAVAATDNKDNLAWFSNYGAQSVDLAAPGVGIYSTVPGGRYATYSGTSMATPFVSGVGALAWSLNPNATVDQVRNAILQGADHIAALNGKVATGGRLDAYNTLSLIAGAVHRPPQIASLGVAPGSAIAGTPVLLTAQGVLDLDGSVARVSFYEDANGNGQWDGADRLLGTTTAIANQQAGISLDTTNLASGTHRLFAAAQDNELLWSTAATATLDILPPDDHGNNAATATRIFANSTTAGAINRAGDKDWFAVDLIAGHAYVFQTELRGLKDSVLTLYGSDGRTQLTWDDDGGGGLASRIVWTARQSGTHYLEVQSYDPQDQGAYALRVSSQNAAPVVADMRDQTMSYRQDKLVLPLQAADADGDRLTWSAQALTAGGQPVAGVAVTVSGNQLTIDPAPGFRGSFLVRVTASDGQASDSKTIQVNVVSTTPQLAAIPNQTLGANRSLQVTLGGSDWDGDPLTYSAQLVAGNSLAAQAYTLSQQLGLRSAGRLFENFRGAGERYMLGSRNTWYFVLPNGEMHRFAGSIASSPRVAQFSQAYYANPSLLYNARPPQGQVQPGDAALSLRGNVLTITPRAGFVGTFQITVSVSDGTTAVQQTFQATVAAASTTAVRKLALDGAAFEPVTIGPGGSFGPATGAVIADPIFAMARLARSGSAVATSHADSMTSAISRVESGIEEIAALVGRLPTEQSTHPGAADHLAATTWTEDGLGTMSDLTASRAEEVVTWSLDQPDEKNVVLDHVLALAAELDSPLR